MSENSTTTNEEKYLVTLTLGIAMCSFEVPVYAGSIEEAELKTHEYEDAGFEVHRIRPAVSH